MARPWERPCSLDSGGPCRNDGLIQQHWSLAEARTATYVYGEEGLIAEYQAQGNNAAQLAAQYGWQPEGTWGTDPVWIKTTPTGGNQAGYFYYQNDHLGTPQKIIDGQGQSVWSQKSTAFGETTVDSASALVNNLRFPGQYFDAETDLHYNGFRDYDPGIGRYSESDPIGLDGGINQYAYVGGNPISLFDPDGLCFGSSCHLPPGTSPGDLAYPEPYNATPLEVGRNRSQPRDDPAPTFPWPDKRSGKYVCNCRAQCNGNCLKPGEDMQYGVGTAMGNNLPATKRAAQDAAESLITCQGKHTTCKCTNPKGQRIFE